MADIVISEFMDEVVARRAFSSHSFLYDPSLVDDPKRLAAMISNAQALIVRNRTKVTAELLVAGPDLKAVGRLGVGLDNINLEACKERGVAVYAARGGPDVSVAEYVITASLVLVRGAWFASDAVLAGAWPRTKLIGSEIFGKRLGLVGFGATAKATASRARSLGMKVAAFDPKLQPSDAAWKRVQRVSLDTLLRTSDVVSLHIPLTAQTRSIIDGAAMERMKPGAMLINASRGGTVDEVALIEALRSGRLGGAALDVFDAEPLNRGRAARFANVPNLILTPHIAGVTRESNLRVSEIVAAAVAKHLATAT